MKPIKRLRSLLLLICLVAATQMTARADIALGFTNVAVQGGGANATFGWAFTLSVPELVTDLGWFDDGNNGFAGAHPVGIWTSAGVLLIQGTVPAGTAAPLLNGFRYTPVTQTLLAPGSYTIGGFSPPNTFDPIAVMASSITTAPGITYNGSRSVSGASLTFPSGNEFGATNSYFGPNYQFVPEPTTAGLLLFCGAAAGAVAWRRARRTRAL